MTQEKEANRVFDFRMDVQSWFMLIGIFVAFWLLILPATFGVAAGDVSTGRYLLMSLLMTLLLISLATIPVVIGCIFIKRIPDIDYAIWVSAALVVFTILGIALN